ncbi:M61 family metallopeptidase [Gaetbulibacter aestuarii]|uniref:Peptidase M61 n=1 Tax=Gaetbulibacter aestuarii TaxID=1502358 RepID=A0ABW7N215_9FLAO
MRAKILALFMAGLLVVSCNSTKSTTNDLATVVPIESSINLTKVSNDKVPVTIDPGRFTQKTITFRLPKVVQGTYAISDFGKYIDDFKALDYSGKEMPFVHVDDNTWTISDAKNLDKITYWVNDTFDQEKTGGIGYDVPFSPSGTDIEPDEFVLNLHGFVGYFESLQNHQYKIEVTSPSDFKRVSALPESSEKTSEDGQTLTTTYLANRYFDVTDNPMMYGKQDVDAFNVGNIKIVLSVYSPSGKHTAASLKNTVYKMMQAQKAFLGDINSTPEYHIFLYLSEGTDGYAKGYGALEHHTSTVVVFPDAYSNEELGSGMIDVVSHEFFHIVTPLSVHSEDIQYFNYNNPTFSKHLWMYEGVTEYFANLFQVNQGLIDDSAFYKKLMDKINYSKQMDDAMSFTIMSENVLKAPYKDQYLNVYQKGALIGMCIDIMMRDESDGKRGILSLMKQLSEKYGKDKPFEDDALIDEIIAMTYPSLKPFFYDHVIGDIPIDYNQYLAKVGLKIGEGRVETGYIQNGSELILAGSGQTGQIFFTDAVSDNSFWHDAGAEPNDVIKSINGTQITLQNANEILNGVARWTPGQEVEVMLERDGEPVEIKTTVTKSYTQGTGIVDMDTVTPHQMEIREAWLKG